MGVLVPEGMSRVGVHARRCAVNRAGLTERWIRSGPDSTPAPNPPRRGAAVGRMATATGVAERVRDSGQLVRADRNRTRSCRMPLAQCAMSATARIGRSDRGHIPGLSPFGAMRSFGAGRGTCDRRARGACRCGSTARLRGPCCPRCREAGPKMLWALNFQFDLTVSRQLRRDRARRRNRSKPTTGNGTPTEPAKAPPSSTTIAAVNH